MVWQEVKQLYGDGLLNYFDSLYNYLDTAVLSLYVASFTLRYFTITMVGPSCPQLCSTTNACAHTHTLTSELCPLVYKQWGYRPLLGFVVVFSPCVVLWMKVFMFTCASLLFALIVCSGAGLYTLFFWSARRLQLLTGFHSGVFQNDLE